MVLQTRGNMLSTTYKTPLSFPNNPSLYTLPSTPAFMSWSTTFEENLRPETGLDRGIPSHKHPRHTQNGHTTGPEDILVTKTLGHLGQKTREEKETKEQNTNLNTQKQESTLKAKIIPNLDA